MIIDVHAHCGLWFFPIFCESPSKVADLCDRYGIEKAIFSSSRAITYDMESGNHETSEFIANDERFYGYVYLNSGQRKESRGQIEAYLTQDRFLGVKLHPSYSGQPANSQATVDLLGSLPKDKIILIHTWGPSGVNQVRQLAGALPKHSIIMGHMGGTAEDGWRAGIEAALQLPNLYLEICGGLLHHDRIAVAAKKVGSNRILFGSDMTLIDPAFSLGQVLDSAITADEKRQILRGNAARLFHFQ